MSKSKNKTYKLPPYVVRMIEELEQLNERIIKANQKMTVRDMFAISSLRLLNKQIELMSKYRTVLMDRISEAIADEYARYSMDESSDLNFSDWLNVVLK